MQYKNHRLTLLFKFFAILFLSLGIKPDDFVYKSVPLMSNNNHTIETLELNCIEHMKRNHFQAACAFECALEELKDSSNSFARLLDSIFLKKVFALDVNSLSQDIVQQVYLSQYFIILRLYKVMFEQYIKSAKSALKDLVVAQSYWQQEAFFLSMSFSQRPLAYSTYSAQYKATIFKNIKILRDLEDQVASILGVCLYGFDALEKIETTENIASLIHKASMPLYQHYNMPISCHGTTVIFDDLKYLQEHMQVQMQDFKEKLSAYQKPSFIVDHAYSLTAVGIISLVAAYTCYQHADQIPGMLDKAQQRVVDFYQQYIQVPIMQLKHSLSHGTKDNNLEDWTFVPPLQWNEWSPSLAGFQTGQYDVTGTVEYANSASAGLKETINPVVKNLNGLGPSIIDITKSVQINTQIAMFTPVVLAGYLGWTGTKKVYNSYMNNNYYLPIKYTLRSIDRLINSVAHGGQRSYACDGKLYMLVLHLHHYSDCFSHEEQMQLAQDIKDLLSFDFTYEQKKGVVDRMYRTYTCVQ